MGFFGGKKNKTPDDEADQASQASARKSRRVVVPGQKPGAGAPANPPTSRIAAPPAPAAPAAQAPAAPAAPAKQPTQRVVAKPPTQAIQRAPAPAPAGKGDSGRVAKVDPGLMLGASEPSSTPTPARPKSREPIVDSAPLAFAGDIASGTRSGGPARTGDAALIEFLVNKAHLVSADQAAHARNKANQDGVALDVAAVQLGFLNEDQLVSALTQECWVPHLKVDKYEIRKKALDTIARDDAVHFGVFPVDKLGSLLTLAMVNPLDQETIRTLESKTGLDIKKVVATRSEINQGIEKYYSGAVVAKDTSLSFTQDTEPKSVTQMLTNVPVAKTDAIAATKSSAPASKPSAPLKAHVDVVPEIQDIDDLLSSDEVIAPAIIEPIGIEPIGAEEIPAGDIEPLSINPNEIEPAVEADPFGDADPFAPTPEIKAPAAKAAPANDLAIDLSFADSAPVEPVAKAPAKPADLSPAPEFLDDQPAIAPAVKPAAPKPAAPAPAPVAAKPAAPAPAKPVAAGAGSSASRPAAKAPAQIVNLMPVMEEEFQHAITHGKAHVFEKWVGLQTRNRIINGAAVEPELETILASLYASPRA